MDTILASRLCTWIWTKCFALFFLFFQSEESSSLFFSFPDRLYSEFWREYKQISRYVNIFFLSLIYERREIFQEGHINSSMWIKEEKNRKQKIKCVPIVYKHKAFLMVTFVQRKVIYDCMRITCVNIGRTISFER